MVEVYPVDLGQFAVIATRVQLPKTDLLILSTDNGYIMCGALDIGLLRDRLASRGIIAARAVGVKTIQQLLEAAVESCTQAAEQLGIHPGMPVRTALAVMHLAAASDLPAADAR